MIDEVYNDDEAHHTSTSKTAKPIRRSSKYKNEHQIIEKMKNSLIVSNQSAGPIETSILENLEQAKEVITSISNQLEYHQKQALKYAIRAGQCLLRIQELCAIENKKFSLFLKECGINWDKSYVYFLISFYNLSKEYPKISNLSLSIHFVKVNFKKMKLAILSSNEERQFWKRM